ncbi:hypothetical protein ZIOFF_007685 [Zingiber officinale]|uniref:RING-type domain-containing protein n=1 Tax=Zingiber officinale TaxID=94328 RepID=A0A8J5HXK7_ZINOF|nr:hypothetical protein ZIOFF_007685 [Zingiber officinale]
MQQQAWERETRVMLARVVANNVRHADLDLLAKAFRDYTSSVVRWLPMMSVLPPDMAAFGGVCSVSQSEDHNNAHFNRGSRPAFATVVEGLKTVAAEKPDSCSICLEDFEMAAPILTMPCSHLFHATCLKKWREHSYSQLDALLGLWRTSGASISLQDYMYVLMRQISEVSF